MQFFSPWLSITVSKTINIFEKHIKELYKKKTKNACWIHIFRRE